MAKINILYDNFYDDVDIIEVPNNIVERINRMAQEYLDWIPPEDDPDSWVVINQNKCLSKGADGFVAWLNSKYCHNSKAYIVSRSVSYCPTYPTIEF